MASNYTENYGLCQWEATDQVLRTEFNKDNAKVDEALKGTADVAQAAQVLAQAAYSPENSPFVVGSYTGDGTAKRKIELGFTPKAVLLVTHDSNFHSSDGYYMGGLAVEGCNACIYPTASQKWVSGDTYLAVTTGGFFVSYVEGSYVSCYTNEKDYLYIYLAVR